MNKPKEIVVHEGNALTPMDMLDRAVSSGASIEVLEKLMVLQERWEANQARKAFDDAMAAAKAEIPVIVKNRRVGFESKRTGDRTDYSYEDMAGIAKIVDPILTKHGLSYRYRTTSEPGQPVTVTCIIAHRMGHSEQTMLTAQHDATGNKNSIQAIGSTVTYLQRYTLKAALGLSASDDDDGSGSTETISSEQIDTIRSLIVEVAADIPRFCKYMKVAKIEDIPAKEFDRAVKALEAKRPA